MKTIYEIVIAMKCMTMIALFVSSCALHCVLWHHNHWGKKNSIFLFEMKERQVSADENVKANTLYNILQTECIKIKKYIEMLDWAAAIGWS